MTANTCAYKNIRDQVIARCQCSDEDLKRLKDRFRNEINSPRRLDNITSLGNLIRVLEKRDISNRRDLQCLRDIVQTLNRSDVLDFINSYNALGQHRIMPPQAPQPPPQTPVLNHHPGTPHERISELIRNEIGIKWKDLARALTISEGRIDALEERYRSISDRVREILVHHDGKYSPLSLNWLFHLLNALTESRRNDLRIEVQRILQGH